jgi:hypothetical protein
MKKTRKDWHVLAEDKNATLPANCKDFAGFDIQVTISGQRSFPQLCQRMCRSRILWRKKTHDLQPQLVPTCRRRVGLS